MTARNRLVPALLLFALLAAGCGTAVTVPVGRSVHIHDATVRFEQLDRVTVQIVRATSDMSDQRYQSTVRPQLLDRLARMGFSEQERALIFTRVDDARADRARVKTWWTNLAARPSQHASR